MQNTEFFLFKVYDRDDEMGNRCHFEWEGKGAFAFQVMVDGYRMAADALYDKCKQERGNYRIQDALIYPLCFMYRHAMELSVKYLYINHFKGTEGELNDFLKQCNHSILDTWRKVKPILSVGKKKVGTKVNIGQIEEYVKAMDWFDTKSIRMRYPIDKKNNKQEKREANRFLDIDNLYENMCTFFEMIEKIDWDLDHQVRLSADEECGERFLMVYAENRQTLLKFVDNLKGIPETVNEHVDFRTIIKKYKTGSLLDMDHFFRELPLDCRILADVLFYVGRNLLSAHLSLAPGDKAKELIQLCLWKMESGGMEFGKEVSERKFNMCSKSPKAVIRLLAEPIRILDKALELKTKTE